MKKKKKLGKNGPLGFESTEDIEDMMGMDSEELLEVSREHKSESDHSQAETLARTIQKLDAEAREAALGRLRREDILLFETVEYLLARLKRT